MMNQNNIEEAVKNIQIDTNESTKKSIVINQNNYDILIIAYQDWANTGYRFSKCLEIIGLNVKIIKMKKHKNNYPEQAEIYNSISKLKECFPLTIKVDEYIRNLIKESYILNLHASTYIDHENKFDYRDINTIVTHGGTTYRKYPELNNKIYNSFVKKTIIQCPDLLNLGAKNEVLVYYPIDSENITPDFSFKHENKLIIGHFPSSTSVKGTKKILSAINKLKNKYSDKFIYIGSSETHPNIVSWEENLKRYKNCDIIIETVNEKQNGKPYGEWGNTCLEAAISGCIVLTNCHSKNIYLKEYNCEPEFMITNNEDDIIKNLLILFKMSQNELLKKKINIYNWAKNNHSFKATGLRLWNKVYKDLFPKDYLLNKSNISKKMSNIIMFSKEGGMGGSSNLNNAINKLSKYYKSKLICLAKSAYNFGEGIFLNKYNFDYINSLVEDSQVIFIFDYTGIMCLCKYLEYKFDKDISIKNIFDKSENNKIILTFLKKYKVIFNWSGSRYLNDHKNINNFVKLTGCNLRFAMLDLIRCDQEALPLYQCYDLKKFMNFKFEKFNKFTLCHSPGAKIKYPKGPNGKGTFYIENVFKKMKLKYDIDYHIITNMGNNEVLKLKQKCHVFVDQICNTIGGMGKSGLESFILGTPVVCDVHNVNFEGRYSNCPVIHVNDEDELFNKLEYLYLHPEELNILERDCIEWSKVLSYESTIEYIDEKIENYI